VTVLKTGLGDVALLSELGLVVVLYFMQNQIFGLSDMNLWLVELSLVVIRRPLSNIPFFGQAFIIHIFKL
jgi:hypothetical protein